MTSEELLAAMSSMDDSPNTRETLLKAPFPYPGGKQNSIEVISQHLPKTDYYREPFGGSGAILLSREKAKNEYFNDRFSGVTDFYHCVKDKTLLPRLLEWLNFTPFSREEFIRCRDVWKTVTCPVERAARWYVQVLMSFQAYGRHFGRSKQATAQFSMKLPNQLKGFWPVHYRLQGTYIENVDWRVMMKDLDNSKAVWYCDPPYLNSGDGMYEHVMSRQDHVELCERIHQLEGWVALSGYPNDLYDKFPWDYKLTWEVRSTANASIGTESNNRLNCESLANETRTEALWVKKWK